MSILFSNKSFCIIFLTWAPIPSIWVKMTWICVQMPYPSKSYPITGNLSTLSWTEQKTQAKRDYTVHWGKTRPKFPIGEPLTPTDYVKCWGRDRVTDHLYPQVFTLRAWRDLKEVSWGLLLREDSLQEQGKEDFSKGWDLARGTEQHFLWN